MRPLRDVSSSIGRTVASLRRSAMPARRAARPTGLEVTLAALPSGLLGEALTEILSTRLRDAVRWWVAVPSTPSPTGTKRGRIESDAAGPDSQRDPIDEPLALPSPASRLRQALIGEPGAVRSDWRPAASLPPDDRLAVSSPQPSHQHHSGGGARAAPARSRLVPRSSEQAAGRAATSLAPLQSAVSRYWAVLRDRRPDGEAASATIAERVGSAAEPPVSRDRTNPPSRRIDVSAAAREDRPSAQNGSVHPAPAERWWQSRVEALLATSARPAVWASGSAGDRPDAIDEQLFADVLAEVLRDQAEQYGVPLT